MSRGFDLIRRHISGKLAGNKDAAAKINDASGEDVASDTPWLDAMSGGVRQGLPLSAREAQSEAIALNDAGEDDAPPLTATEMLRRQIPKFLQPSQSSAKAVTPANETPRQQGHSAPVAPPREAQAMPVAPIPTQRPLPPNAPRTNAPRPGDHSAVDERDAPSPPPGIAQKTAPTSEAYSPSPTRAPVASAHPASSFDERRIRERRHTGQGSEDSQIDRRHAKAARRHSIFVAMMKGLLPSLVLGLVGVFFFYSYDFRPDILPDNVNFDPGEVSLSTDGIKMVAPKLTGVDEKQQTFEVKADAAIQDRQDPAKVTLEGIDARINLKEGGTVGISAQNGIYNTDLNQIWLRDDLEIRSSEGYVAQLSEAQVDFKNGLMVSNKPVLIFTNNGVINASGVQVLDGGEKVKFSGPVVLNLNANTGDSEEESAGETQ